jgi:8-oxo-dGTP pyrophosphatase MutT (NUDIX family)
MDARLPRFPLAEPFRQRATQVLHPAPVEPPRHAGVGLPLDQVYLAQAKAAAVLYPIVARPEGLSIVLTERAAHLASHAGQVAFPGGRIEPGEAALEAALREAWEEIGLAPQSVVPLGFLPTYYSGTGYRVAPLVGLVDPSAVFVPDPGEVARVFEVPLVDALDLKRYRTSSVFWQGKERNFYILDHDAAYIWGVTAGILRSFAERY